MFLKFSTHCEKLGQTQNIIPKDNIIENDGDVFSQNQGDILHLNNHLYPTTHANLITKNIYDMNETKEIKVDKKRKKVNQPLCRICLSEDNETSNPLINPCTCSGTMKYIHLFCLKQW